MFFVASGGLVVNILDAFILHSGLGHGHSHGHSGGHNHGHAHGPIHKGHGHVHIEGGRAHAVKEHEEHGGAPKGDVPEHGEAKNINVYSAFIHVLGDCIQSVGVMIASALIWWKPHWKIADPIATFLFSAIVLVTTIRLLRQSLEVLMEGVPQGIDIGQVQIDLESITEVAEIHDLHIWSITVGQPALSVHLIVHDHDSEVSTDATLQKVNRLLKERHAILHTTIQIERQPQNTSCDNIAFHSNQK